MFMLHAILCKVCSEHGAKGRCGRGVKTRWTRVLHGIQLTRLRAFLQLPHPRMEANRGLNR